MTARRRPAERAVELIPLAVADIFELAGRLGRIGDELASSQGQSGARWKVLSAASVEPPRTIAQLARRLGHTRQSVQRIADLLVADRLAAYVANPDHARSPLLRLTDRGRAVLEQLTAHARTFHRGIAAELDAAALETTLATLRALIAALSRHDRDEHLR